MTETFTPGGKCGECNEYDEPDVSEAIEVTAADLPLFCPRPDAPLWARHPRVYLEVVTGGDVVCPYCSAHYVFHGAPPKGH